MGWKYRLGKFPRLNSHNVVWQREQLSSSANKYHLPLNSFCDKSALTVTQNIGKLVSHTIEPDPPLSDGSSVIPDLHCNLCMTGGPGMDRIISQLGQRETLWTQIGLALALVTAGNGRPARTCSWDLLIVWSIGWNWLDMAWDLPQGSHELCLYSGLPAFSGWRGVVVFGLFSEAIEEIPPPVVPLEQMVHCIGLRGCLSTGDKVYGTGWYSHQWGLGSDSGIMLAPRCAWCQPKAAWEWCLLVEKGSMPTLCLAGNENDFRCMNVVLATQKMRRSSLLTLGSNYQGHFQEFPEIFGLFSLVCSELSLLSRWDDLPDEEGQWKTFSAVKTPGARKRAL